MDKKSLTAQNLITAIKQGKNSLVDYRHILLINSADEVDPAPFHPDWSDIILNGIDNLALESFRESAKTQYAIRSFLLHAITFPSTKRDYIVFIKNNDTLSGNILKDIEREAATNPVIAANCKKVHECSGDVYSVDRVSESGEIINVRIEAYGKGASIRGLANRDRRPKIVLIDDPQDMEDAKSDTIQENDWNWFLSDVLFLGQHSRIILIGNNMGEKCIIERIFATEGKLERVKFTTIRIAIVNDEGKSSWPSKFSMQEIEQEKRDYEILGKLDIWLRERMCQATSEETRVFRDHDYRHYTASRIKQIVDNCNLFATLDPAYSKDKSACYRALTINAVDPENNWFIPVIYYGRWDSYELMNVLFEARREWAEYGLRDFGIEKGEYKEVIEPFLLEEMKRRNVFFNIIPIEHAKVGTKLERIKMLQPRFKAHGIWFPDDAPDWLIELKLELKGVTNSAIKSLFIDLADSLCMQEQIAKKPINRQMHIVSKLPRVSEVEEHILQ